MARRDSDPRCNAHKSGGRPNAPAATNALVAVGASANAHTDKSRHLCFQRLSGWTRRAPLLICAVLCMWQSLIKCPEKSCVRDWDGIRCGNLNFCRRSEMLQASAIPKKKTSASKLRQKTIAKTGKKAGKFQEITKERETIHGKQVKLSPASIKPTDKKYENTHTTSYDPVEAYAQLLAIQGNQASVETRQELVRSQGFVVSPGLKERTKRLSVKSLGNVQMMARSLPIHNSRTLRAAKAIKDALQADEEGRRQVFIQIALKRIKDRPLRFVERNKPLRIRLPNCLWKAENPKICLITRNQYRTYLHHAFERKLNKSIQVPANRSKLGVTYDARVVTEVSNGSLGEMMGLRKGDTIYKVGKRSVRNQAELISAIKKARKKKKSFSIGVHRVDRYGDSANIRRIMSIDRLRIAYKRFQFRRELMREYDMFLCDKGASVRVAQLTGSTFYERRKSPLPIKLENNRTRVESEIEIILNSTFVFPTSGDCVSIRIGDQNHSSEELSENLRCALAATVEKMIPGKWENILSINLNAEKSSVSIPVYHEAIDFAGPMKRKAPASAVKTVKLVKQKPMFTGTNVSEELAVEKANISLRLRTPARQTFARARPERTGSRESSKPLEKRKQQRQPSPTPFLSSDDPFVLATQKAAVRATSPGLASYRGIFSTKPVEVS